MIHVIASIELKPECFDEFLTVFKENMVNVRAEDGCIDYVPCVDVESGLSPQVTVREHVVTVLETWESTDHLRAHLATPHMLKYEKKTQDMKVSTQVQVIEPA
ncbi:MAG: putative quinol monooxygenase [Victivallales bacterium]|nr:putative quinol monooxygenase [Victivallales bacterium]